MGKIIQGYWNDPRKVRWKPEVAEDLDTRLMLGGEAQVWYGFSWIHTPAVTELEFEFQGHLKTNLRWFLSAEGILMECSE